MLVGAGGDDSIDAREGASAAGRAAQAGSVDRVVCGGGNDTALVDPVDVVDASCENVVGGAGDDAADSSGGQTPPVRIRRLRIRRGLRTGRRRGSRSSDESVDENEPAGTEVGALSATDPDAGDTHSFALVPGAGSADNGSFEIVGSTLRTGDVLDYETKSSYSVRVRATDSGTPAGEFERTFYDHGQRHRRAADHHDHGVGAGLYRGCCGDGCRRLA